MKPLENDQGAIGQSDVSSSTKSTSSQLSASESSNSSWSTSAKTDSLTTMNRRRIIPNPNTPTKKTSNQIRNQYLHKLGFHQKQLNQRQHQLSSSSLSSTSLSSTSLSSSFHNIHDTSPPLHCNKSCTYITNLNDHDDHDECIAAATNLIPTINDRSNDKNSTLSKHVSFQISVQVRVIPSVDMYSEQMKEILWTPPIHMAANVTLNRIEFAHENHDFRQVLEEDAFLICPKTGHPIHPAHIYSYSGFFY